MRHLHFQEYQNCMSERDSACLHLCRARGFFDDQGCLGEAFDQEYFEYGILTGKSLYYRYRWMPDLSSSLARAVIQLAELCPAHSILDFGSAKGFLVKALRRLDMLAWGCDISQYAISHVDPEVKAYCRPCGDVRIIPFDRQFDVCISKDVFEHIDTFALDIVLRCIGQRCVNMVAIVPLGDNGKFNIREYHLDVTHRIAQSEKWWARKFRRNGWTVLDFRHAVDGIKDNWAAKHPRANGIFVLTTRSRDS